MGLQCALHRNIEESLLFLIHSPHPYPLLHPSKLAMCTLCQEHTRFLPFHLDVEADAIPSITIRWQDDCMYLLEFKSSDQDTEPALGKMWK